MIDPNKSKLYAGIKNGLKLDFNNITTCLYLGASHGYTINWLKSKIDWIIAVEKSINIFEFFLKQDFENVIPILADAYQPASYENRVVLVDFLFQDISQKDQVLIFKRNIKFLKDNGIGILVLKAKSVSSTKDTKYIFEDSKEKLKDFCNIVQEINLDLYQKDHVMFVVNKK